MEFHDPDAIVDVIRLGKFRVMLESADGEAGFWGGVVQETEREVDVVDGAVDEDAAVAFGVGDEEACFVQEIAGV